MKSIKIDQSYLIDTSLKKKFIVIISQNLSQSQFDNLEQNENSSYKDNLHYSVFTSISPGNKVIYNSNPITGRELNYHCNSPYNLNQYIQLNKLDFLEFSECYGEFHTTEQIFNNSLGKDFLLKKENSFFLFSSQNKHLKIKNFENFLNQTLYECNLLVKSQKVKKYDVLITVVYFDDNLYEGYFIQSYSDERSKKFINNINYSFCFSSEKKKNQDINIFVQFHFPSGLKLTFCKLDFRTGNEKLNTILNKFSIIKGFKIKDYRKLFMISIVEPEQSKFNDSKNELLKLSSMMNEDTLLNSLFQVNESLFDSYQLGFMKKNYAEEKNSGNISIQIPNATFDGVSSISNLEQTTAHSTTFRDKDLSKIQDIDEQKSVILEIRKLLVDDNKKIQNKLDESEKKKNELEEKLRTLYINYNQLNNELKEKKNEIEKLKRNAEEKKKNVLKYLDSML